MARYFTLDLVPQKGGQLGLTSAGVFLMIKSSIDDQLQKQIVSPIVTLPLPWSV